MLAGVSIYFCIKNISSFLITVQSLYEQNLNKTATQDFLQFSVSFMCLEAYTKNPLSFDLRKLFFLAGC